jgi:putative transport protein
VVGLSVGVVLLGRWLLGLEGAATVGVLAGATTNTPSLAAAQQALASLPDLAGGKGTLTATAYAVAYPLGVIGIIGSIALLKLVLRADPAKEAAELEAASTRSEPIERRTVLIENENLIGLAIRDLPHIESFGARISRRRAAGSTKVELARGSTVLGRGDLLLIVGVRAELDAFELLVGRRSDEDLTAGPGEIVFRSIVVTRKGVLGKRLDEVHLGKRFGVQVTRLTRSDIEIAAYGSLRLQFGDALRLVGDEASIARAASELGNSIKALSETQFAPIMLGVGLGLALGLVPMAVPGLPEPVRLGLAGGPLIMAIVVSRLGSVGPLVWHVPRSANLALRELGIMLFLACVGLKAGPAFVQTAATPTGLRWAAVALAVSVVPLVVIGLIARLGLRMNFATLSGLLAGSMTDPPALAFANGAAKSDAPAAAYATVYPLTMILRIITAQVLIYALCG